MSKRIVLSMIATAVCVSTAFAVENVEVFVTSATKSEQSIRDVTSVVEVITGAELSEKHTTTVIDALRSIANIPMGQSGGVGEQSSFFLRGFAGGNTLVLVDGIKYNDPTTTEGQAQLEHLMINDIERIEIIKGAQSGVWGANAVAGVINIITKKATQKLAVNINVETGSFNTKKYAISVSQKIDKLSYYLGLNQIKTDGISAQVPAGENEKDYEKDGYKNRTINAKLGYDLTANDEVKLNVTDIDAKVDYDAWGTPNDSGSRLTQKNRLYKTLAKHSFNNESYVELGHSKTEFKKDDPLGWTKKFEGSIQENVIDFKFGYLADSFIIFGANTQEGRDKISDNKIKSNGLYLTNNNIFGNLILTESLRQDNFDKFNDKATGKVGAKYNFTKDLTFSANYGSAYKAPSLSQLFDPAFGNKNLKPESTLSSDMSLEFRKFKISYFENKIRDLIDFDPNTWKNIQATGTSKIKGIDASFTQAIGEDLLFTTSATKLSAKNSNGEDLQRRADVVANFFVDYYGLSNTHLTLFANYIGTRYDDLAKTKQTGRYTLLNSVINYAFSQTYKIYAKVENLTDKKYQEVDGYGTCGRSVYVGLSAKF